MAGGQSGDAGKPVFNLDELQREMREDEAAEPASRRKLTQEEILRLVQERRAKQRPPSAPEAGR